MRAPNFDWIGEQVSDQGKLTLLGGNGIRTPQLAALLVAATLAAALELLRRERGLNPFSRMSNTPEK